MVTHLDRDILRMMINMFDQSVTCAIDMNVKKLNCLETIMIWPLDVPMSVIFPHILYST